MYRCSLAAAVAIAFALSASAQALRTFPPTALRGAVVFGEYPQVKLNGRATSLSPGARVRSQDNTIVIAATLAGSRMLVHYTLDTGGQQLRDVWILRPEEAAIKPWPSTPEEAQSWTYDPNTQTWAKP